MSLEAPQVQQKSDILKKIRLDGEDALAQFKLSDHESSKSNSQNYEPMDQDQDQEIHDQSLINKEPTTLDEAKANDNNNDSSEARKEDSEMVTSISSHDEEGGRPSSEEIDKASMINTSTTVEGDNKNEMEGDNNIEEGKIILKEDDGARKGDEDEDMKQMTTKEEGQPEPETLASCAEGNGSDVPPQPSASAENSHSNNSIEADHHQNIQNQNNMVPNDSSPQSTSSGPEQSVPNSSEFLDEKPIVSQIQKSSFQEIQSPPLQQNANIFRQNYRLNNNNNNNNSIANNLNNNHIKGKIADNLPVVNLSSLQQRGVIHYNPHMGPNQDKRKNYQNCFHY